MRPALPAALLLALAAGAGGEDVKYRVMDRREADGSVVLVRQVPRERIQGKAFLAAAHWELTPSTHYFRVREARIPARHVGPKGDPPAITFRGGQVVGNSWTNMFGGEAETYFEKGEIVRLVSMNCAFKTVRMDFEPVCRPDRSRNPLRGRTDFGLSGQVGGKTLEEANQAVSAVLEPMELARVLEVCDPETKAPPVAVAKGALYDDVRARLGPPRASRAEGGEHVVDYDVIRLHVRDGRVARIVIPAVD